MNCDSIETVIFTSSSATITSSAASTPARASSRPIAGTGEAGFSGDGGPAIRAQFRQPHSIAFDASGNLLVCDIGNSRVRRVDMRAGTISTLAGTGTREPTPDEGPIEGTPLNGPRSLDTDPGGNIYLVLREGNAVFRLDVAAGRLKRIAGTGATGYAGDGGPAVAATFNGPKGIAYAPDQSLIVADTENHVIRRVDLKTGMIDTLIGSGQRGDGPDGDPRQCRMARPHGVCLHQGSLIVSDSENHRLAHPGLTTAACGLAQADGQASPRRRTSASVRDRGAAPQSPVSQTRIRMPRR